MLTAGSDDTIRAAGVGDLGEGSMDPDGVEGGADPGEEGGTDPGGLSLRNGARCRGPGGVRRAQLEEERATQTAPGGGAHRPESRRRTEGGQISPAAAWLGAHRWPTVEVAARKWRET
jgi:hypothetical protein